MPAKDRLEKLQKGLKEQKLDGLLIEDPTNLLYLLGLKVSRGSLLLGPSDATFFVDARYFEKCRKDSPVPVALTKKAVLEQILEAETPLGRLGFDSHNTSYSTVENWRKTLKEKKRENLELVPVPNPLKIQRAIKDEQEIKRLSEAAKLGSAGYDFVKTILRRGITEIEVAKELEIFWLRQGGDALAFSPIIAFGPNTSIPHYTPSQFALEQGHPVLLDIGVTLDEYHSDMTRVLFFGKPSPEMKNLYELVKEGQAKALNLCRPGVTTGELDQTVRDLFGKQGLADKFSHSLGHGIGLEVHEFPTLSYKADHKDTKLEPGMAITIEPGLYLEGQGGVRIEDTVVITPEGHINLTSRGKELQSL